MGFANPPDTAAPAFAEPTNPLGFGQECTTSLPLDIPITQLFNLTAAQLGALGPIVRSLVSHQTELQSLAQLAAASGFPI